MGSISDNDRVGLGISRSLYKKASFFIDLSAFKVRSRADSAYSARGVSAASSVGITLTPKLSVNLGAQYQHYDQTSIFGFEQKRIYLSLRFTEPGLWRVWR